MIAAVTAAIANVLWSKREQLPISDAAATGG
jgi:hypothetical protein